MRAASTAADTAQGGTPAGGEIWASILPAPSHTLTVSHDAMDVRGSGPEVKAANFAFTSVQLLYALQKKLLCVRMWPTPFDILCLLLLMELFR